MSIKLLYCLRDGSEKALSMIMSRYTDELLRYAYSIVKDKELAEEIVEDVFFKLWEYRAKAPAIDNLKAYLVRAVRNSALSRLRNATVKGRKLEDSISDTEIELSASSFEDEWLTHEYHDFVMQEVEALPNRCKEVIVLSKINGMRQKDIALLLNISPKTVENTLARAIQKLRERFSMMKSIVS